MAQMTVLTGPERRRRWSEDEQRQILAAAFAPGAIVREVSRRYDVATSLIYKWRRAVLAAEPGPAFTEMVVVPTVPAVAPVSAAAVEIEIGGKVRLRLPTTTPPALAAALVKALGAR